MMVTLERAPKWSRANGLFLAEDSGYSKHSVSDVDKGLLPFINSPVQGSAKTGAVSACFAAGRKAPC